MTSFRAAKCTVGLQASVVTSTLLVLAGCRSGEPAWPGLIAAHSVAAGASLLAADTSRVVGLDDAKGLWLADLRQDVREPATRPWSLPGRVGKPSGLALTTDGAMLVADPEHHRVWRVAPGSTGEATAFAGSGTDFQPIGDRARAVGAQLSRPAALAVAGRETWIADPGFRRVRRVDSEGRIDTVLGSGLKGIWPDAPSPLRLPLPAPGAVAAGPGERVAVADDVHGVVVSGPGDTIALWRETRISGLAWLSDGTLLAARGKTLLGWRGAGSRVLLELEEPATALCPDGTGGIWLATATRTVHMRAVLP
ncbi:MAG: hypothetical protein VKO64_02150 [Candidatus Sericytochromatia bacterium]|nr:hypothetical protein [Candidatus Sericytochromatia bacterium]